jgi:hypothetical protein
VSLKSGGGDFLSTLALPGLFEDEDRVAFDRANLSQWFTPAPLALRMARWAGPDVIRGRLLEPSAGGGALIRAAIEAGASSARIEGVELDMRWYDRLVADDALAGAHFELGNYLMRPAPAVRYDLTLTNPPYEGGLDGIFLEKTMAESMRVIALIRTVAANGKARHKRVWSRCGIGREWTVTGWANLVERPDFGGEHGAKADFIVVKLSRAELGEPAVFQPEWWTADDTEGPTTRRMRTVGVVTSTGVLTDAAEPTDGEA